MLISCALRQDSEGYRMTCQPARQWQYRRSGQIPRPAKVKFYRRHVLRPFPGPSPSLLGPDASSPAKTASAAGVAWQRVSLLYEVQGRSPLPSISNADCDPGHTLERVTAVTPLSETPSTRCRSTSSVVESSLRCKSSQFLSRQRPRAAGCLLLSNLVSVLTSPDRRTMVVGSASH